MGDERMKAGDFTAGAMPDDITVGEARRFVEREHWFVSLRRDFPRLAVRVYRADEPDREVPDTMTMGEMRRLVNEGKVKVSFDDGSGGELEDA